MAYSELLTVLPFIQEDDEEACTEEDIANSNLEEAHLFAKIWAKLYVRGVLTAAIFDAGCNLLYRHQDYARIDILDTILITALRDAISEGRPVYLERLESRLVKLRELRMSHLEKL